MAKYLNITIWGMNSMKEDALQAFKKAFEIDRSEIYGWLLSRYAPLFAEKELVEPWLSATAF